jgi:hypothetical protein
MTATIVPTLDANFFDAASAWRTRDIAAGETAGRGETVDRSWSLGYDH